MFQIKNSLHSRRCWEKLFAVVLALWWQVYHSSYGLTRFPLFAIISHIRGPTVRLKEAVKVRWSLTARRLSNSLDVARRSFPFHRWDNAIVIYGCCLIWPFMVVFVTAIEGLSQWNWDNAPYEHAKHYIRILQKQACSVVQRVAIELRTRFLQWNVSTTWQIVYKHMYQPLWKITEGKKLRVSNCF